MRNPLSPSVHAAVNIEDLRQLARRRLPNAVFDYIDGGADGEVTLRDNRRSWDEVLFRPRNAVRVPACDTTTELFGARLSMPMLLAPLGYARLFHPHGEIGAARAARTAGIGYVLSTFAGYRVDEVAAAAGTLWYQLYLAGGRAVVETSLARAWNAGCRVLAVTIDTNAPGHRERDIRNHSAQTDWRRRAEQGPLRAPPAPPSALAGRLPRRPQGGDVLPERRHPRQRTVTGP